MIALQSIDISGEHLALAGAIAISVLNALMNHYADKKGFVKVLNVILDLLSVTTRKNSPSSIKFPLTTSKGAL